MSDLKNICQQVTEIAGEMQQWASDLETQAGQIRRSAGQTRTLTRHRPPDTTAVTALDTAARQCHKAAASLSAAKTSAELFVALHRGNGAPSGREKTKVGEEEADRSASSPLAAFWESHPGEYLPPSDADWEPVPETLPAHSDPRDFASWVNDGGHGVPGRDVNCADCARAVETSWRGQPQVSAARADEGESFSRIEEWLGSPLTPSSFADIGTDLTSAGPGSSAYVVVVWKGGRGHAFNAVNYEGGVYFIDAQPTGGAVDTWPPKRTSPNSGYDESDVSQVFVKTWGPEEQR